MDKLQWFKFTPSDWMMGKIQRCPEITQARFMRLCCLYWNKDCNLSIDDAEIEIDKEHFAILKSKKIISVNDTHFNIAYLDEQFLEIQESSKDKRKSGIIGNLKRWHPAIYTRYKNKEINLEDAVNISKDVAHLSHTDRTPIATPSQNIAEKKREYKEILLSELKNSDVENNKEFSKYLNVTLAFQELFKRNLKEAGASEKKVNSATGKWVDDIRLLYERDGYNDEHIKKVFNFLKTSEFWKPNILSTSKLRKQFEKLLMQEKKEKNGNKQRNNFTRKEFESGIEKAFYE